ncbi:MAG: peptidase M1 [Acidobacteria bacterium]|nr:peptidase M1 [Acidobacteriota bacterium]
MIRLLGFTACLAWVVAAQDKRPRLDVENYQIEAEVDPRAQTLSATVQVQVTALEDTLSAVFELNNSLSLARVTDGSGKQIPATRTPQDFTVRLNFPEKVEKGKQISLTFAYEGRLLGNPDESPVYGIKFASIQQENAYLLYPARWFPLNEYTADRFAAVLKITVPSGFTVLASGLETKSESSGKTTFEFNNPRASFPGSIAVVKSQAVKSNAGGVTTTMYFRGEGTSVTGAYGEEVGKIMAFLTDFYGTPLLSSLTLVETENGAPNGYSAPGLIFLSPKAIGKAVNSRLLVNQIARQWWQNSVSPVSRNHIWLANGGARFAELLWIEQASGAGAMETELRDIYVEALTVDEPPVIQSARLEDYSPEFTAVTSAKGAAVMGMLRHVIGEEAYKKTVKAFLTENAGKSVSTDVFRKYAETASTQQLQGFFIQWIESQGAPEFKLEYTVYRTQKGFRVMGKIMQDLDTFRMPVDLLVETEGNPERKSVEVVGTASEFVIETFGRPKKVTLDPNYRVLRYNNQVRVAVAIRRGEMFAEISEFNDAIKEYQKALDVNRNSSLAHYRVGEVFFLQRNYQSAANEFRYVFDGDLEPKWTEVWAHINLGKIFDITNQRERAVNEYNQAIRTKDNTQGAQEEAAKYLKTPYQRPAAEN